MRIVHTESSCAWGGQEIRVLSEMAGMAARGHKLALVCPPESRIYDEARSRGLVVSALPIAKKNVKALLAMRRELRRLQPDVVVTHSSTDSWLTALSIALEPVKVPLVRIRHISATVSRNVASRWLYGRAAARVVTTGEQLRETLMRDLDLVPEKVVSIPTGIDLEYYSPGNRFAARRQLGLKEEAPLVGIVATLRSWKGHRYLLEAFAGMSNTDAHLVIVGDGPGRENLRLQAIELGITGRVSMPGNQNHVAPWLSALDVFVLPSYANEGVPQALMQAQACGIAVISTGVGAIPEIVEDGVSGLLVPPRDADALRNALNKVLDDADLRSRLAEAGLAQARRRYSDKIMIDRMEAVLADAIARPQAS